MIVEIAFGMALCLLLQELKKVLPTVYRKLTGVKVVGEYTSKGIKLYKK